MSRQVRERINRARARVKALPQRSWWPEAAGVGLLVVAALNSSGVLA